MKILCSIFLFCALKSEASAQNWFSSQSILKHISVLAADSLHGRATGTEYERKAADYIVSQLKANGIRPKGENNSWFQEFDFQSGIHGTGGDTRKARNVVGYLNNNRPFTIVIGAHYDHLGDGNDGHSLEKNPEGKIHNGADDNASGIAGLIELARYYAGNAERENFNFLFIAFSGEEAGLLGSSWFCGHPTIELKTVSCMVNMDMIGRLNRDKAVLTVSGTGTCAVFQPLIKSFSSAAIQIETDSSGLGPSDHASFYTSGIPALHFFTGSHADYHKPGDDVEKINAPGEEGVLLIIAGLIAKLPADKKAEFLKTRNPAPIGSSSFKVTLGIMPSYAPSDSGLKAEAVLDGKPAAKAGMKDGDVIIKLGDFEIKEIQSYMDALGKFSKGVKTTVTVMRGMERLVLPIEF